MRKWFYNLIGSAFRMDSFVSFGLKSKKGEHIDITIVIKAGKLHQIFIDRKLYMTMGKR